MENLPATLESKSMFFDVDLFEHAQRVAQVFAKSTMVPEQFRNNLGNCLIAMNYANRIKADMFMCMQTMHVIHGKPGVEGKLVAALINQSGKYSEPLKYQWLDAQDIEIESHLVINNDTKDYRGCRAYTADAKSGETVYGPKITWQTVHAEGWYAKNGSKWKTIPELMFMYRAASWFANVHCPEVKLGMQTVEELKDIVELRPSANGSFATADDLTKAIQDNAEITGQDKEKTETKYPCPWPNCDFESPSERGLKSHLTRSHDGKEPESEKPEDLSTYKCGECGQAGMSAEELNVHQCPEDPGSSSGNESDQTEKLKKDLARQIKDFDQEVKGEAFKRHGMQGAAELERYEVQTLDQLLDECWVVQKELQM